MHLLASRAVQEFPLLLDARLMVHAAADLVPEPGTELEAIYNTEQISSMCLQQGVLRTLGLYGPEGVAAGGAGGGRVAVVGDEAVFEEGGFAREEFGRGAGFVCGCGGRWDGGGRWRSGGRGVYRWIEDGFGGGVGFALVVGGEFHGGGDGMGWIWIGMGWAW
jgi:hypothetical protein